MTRHTLLTRWASPVLILAMLAAGSGVAATPVLGAGCTYSFPTDGGTYPGGIVHSGDVLCGGPGPDLVAR